MRRLTAVCIVQLIVLCCVTLTAASVARSGEASSGADSDEDYAQVLFVEAVENKDGSWCISTTLRHNDEGWDHYANAWQALDEEGNELAWRLLAHPHVDEQPFTRDQCSVELPPHVRKVTVRAKCNVHGFGGRAVVVDLSLPEGGEFKVRRSGEE